MKNVYLVARHASRRADRFALLAIFARSSKLAARTIVNVQSVTKFLADHQSIKTTIEDADPQPAETGMKYIGAMPGRVH